MTDVITDGSLFDDDNLAALEAAYLGRQPAGRSHDSLVRERLAWRRADQEAKDQLAAEAALPADLDSRAGWKPVDLTDVLNGTYEPVLPTLGRRHDGIRVLYPGKEHAIAAEPECAKTWWALLQVMDIIKSGGRVVYVDFEDDERTIVGRLLALGLLKSRLTPAANQFRYVRPEGPHQLGWLLDLLDFGEGLYSTLAVYDGVTEGMQLWGLDPLNQNAAAMWRQLLIKPALAVGSATLATDHVVKDREKRGGYAIGAQHKLAGLNGVQFLMEKVDPFGRGLKGRSRVLVSKDRNGGLRQHGVPVEGAPAITHLGDLVGDATSGEMESLIFWPPKVTDDTGDEAEGGGVVAMPPDLPKVIHQVRAVLLARGPEQSFNDINSRVPVSAPKVRMAIAAMEDSGEVTISDGPNRSKLHSLAVLEGVSDAA